MNVKEKAVVIVIVAKMVEQKLITKEKGLKILKDYQSRHGYSIDDADVADSMDIIKTNIKISFTACSTKRKYRYDPRSDNGFAIRTVTGSAVTE